MDTEVTKNLLREKGESLDDEKKEMFEDLVTLLKIFADLRKQFSIEIFGMGIIGAYASYLYAIAQAAKREGLDENEIYEEGMEYLKRAIENLKK